LVAAAAASGNFVLQLVNRRSQTKVERNVGVLGYGVASVVEELDAVRGRHVAERGTAPRTVGTDLDQDTGSTHGPGGGPSDSPERYADTPPGGLQDTAWFRQ
jgi:hypothetical protein